MNSFKGIDHIGIAVPDLDAATRTYGELLGFSIKATEELPDRGLRVAFVDAGGSEGRIELIAPTRENSEISRFLEKRGAGIHHICISVGNLDEALEEMKKRGARLIDTSPKVGAGGTRIAFIHPKGAEGVLIELVEHAEENPSK